MSPQAIIFTFLHGQLGVLHDMGILCFKLRVVHPGRRRVLKILGSLGSPPLLPLLLLSLSLGLLGHPVLQPSFGHRHIETYEILNYT